MNESDSNESSDSSNDVTGYCAVVATIEEDSESETSDDESKANSFESVFDNDVSEEEEELNMKIEFRKLYDNWLELSREKTSWVEEKLKLHVLNKRLNEELNSEIDKNETLSQELVETRKKIQMLNSGTKDLNEILSVGRVRKSNYGLGYNGESTCGKTNFVHGNTIQPIPTDVRETKKFDLRRADLVGKGGKSNYSLGYNGESTCGKTNFVRGNTIKPVPADVREPKNCDGRRSGCWICGKFGHIKRYCYRFAEKIKRILKNGRFYPNGRKQSQVWIAKADLYPSIRGESQVFHAAYTSTVKSVNQPWYFDSGASRYMTRSKGYLENYNVVKESKVTFGGGTHGNIKREGELKYIEKTTCSACNQDVIGDIRDGIFVSQSKYAKHLMEQFAISSSKSVKIPKSTTLKPSKDENGVNVDEKNCVSLSTAESEYTMMESCCDATNSLRP